MVELWLLFHWKHMTVPKFLKFMSYWLNVQRNVAGDRPYKVWRKHYMKSRTFVDLATPRYIYVGWYPFRTICNIPGLDRGVYISSPQYTLKDSADKVARIVGRWTVTSLNQSVVRTYYVRFRNIFGKYVLTYLTFR